MGRFGTCDRGCGEQKLELVPAVQCDMLAALACSFRVGAEAFGAVAEELALRQPSAEEWEPAYRSLQNIARITLRRYPEVDAQDIDWDEPVEFATTWWCAGSVVSTRLSLASESASGVRSSGWSAPVTWSSGRARSPSATRRGACAR